MDSQMRVRSTARSFVFAATALVLLGVVLVTGCDLTETDQDEPVESIAIVPDSVSMGVGEQIDFTVVGLTASGDTVRDAEFTLRWWSTDSTVFSVETEGLATGQGSGDAWCKVEVTEVTGGKRAGKTGAILRPFDGLDSANVHIF